MSGSDFEGLARILGFSDVPHYYEHLNPNLLNNDHQHYQRPLDPKRVKHIVKSDAHHADIEDGVCANGLVAKRPDGTYWIINGQHHTAAAVDMGVSRLKYKVIESTGWEFEKTVFDLFQAYQTAKGERTE